MQNKLIYFGMVLLMLNVVFGGCFLYPSSPYYCQDLDLDLAKEEMNYYQQPVYDYYLNHKSCAETTDCQEIICKNNCEKEYLGRCPEGPIESYNQCNPGCCKFYTAIGKSCTYESNEWACEVQAWNKDTSRYSFVVNSEEKCLESCSDFYNLEFKIVTFNRGPTKEYPQNTTIITTEEIDKEKQGFNYILLLILIVISLIIVGLLYKKVSAQKIFHYLNRKLLPEKKKSIIKKQQKEEIITTKPKVNPERTKRINKIKREQFLTEVGLEPEEIKEDEFSKLREIYLKQGIPHKKLTKEEKEEYVKKLKEMIE
jgi:hypothetical protein